MRLLCGQQNTEPMPNPLNLIERCILDLTSGDGQAYTIHWDGADGEDPDDVIVLIKYGHRTCFHIAATCGNNDIEDAKAVCCQAVLYRTTQGDADVYFAVLDIGSQVVHFCLCSPSQQEFEDVSQHAVEQEAERIVERMKTYIVSNADVLS